MPREIKNISTHSLVRVISHLQAQGYTFRFRCVGNGRTWTATINGAVLRHAA